MTRRWWVIAALALLLVVWHAFGDGPFWLRYPMVGSSPDAHGTFWMYDWVREEVLSGHFPRATTRMYSPGGMDFLVLNGANVLDALLSVPFQVLLGTGRGELWTCVLIVIGNAVAFFPLARQLAPRSPGAAVVATFWWATNPYVLSEMGGGRPTQAMLWFVPPAILVLMRFASWRDAALLGLLVGLQGLTYWYLPIFFALVLAPYGIGKLVENPKLAGKFAVSVFVAVLVVAPLAWPILQASRAGQIPGIDLDISKTGMWLESVERSNRLYSQFAFVSTAVVLLGAFARFKRSPALAIGLAIALWFALGARFVAFGSVLENRPYGWLFAHSSFISRLNFPARVLSVGYCVAAVSLVPILDASRVKVLPWLLVVLVILEGRSNHLGPGRVLAVPEMPASVIVRMNPGPVLSSPMGAPDVSMVEQSFHHQPMVSGMGDHVETVRAASYDTWLENPWFAELVQADDLMKPWTKADEDQVRAAVRWVWFDRALLARGTDSSLTQTIESRLEVALGTPYYQDSYTAIWDLSRPGSTATEEEKAAAAAAETIVEEEREVCTVGQLRGVLWPWGEGRSSMAATARATTEGASAPTAAEGGQTQGAAASGAGPTGAGAVEPTVAPAQ